MATTAENLRDALDEFEALTRTRTATLKNIGRAKGLAKLLAIFKSGRTLQQRCVEFDRLQDLPIGRGMTGPQATAAAKQLAIAHTKLNDGLALNITAYKGQLAEFRDADRPMGLGLDVLIKRLEQIKHRAKLDLINKTNGYKLQADGEQEPDAKLADDLKRCYLTLKKACDETEALAKVAKARPSEASMQALLIAGAGPRSIRLANTLWKQAVERKPALASALSRAGGGDLDLLVSRMNDATLKKTPKFWHDKLELDEPGWEDRIRLEAESVLKQLPAVRKTADAMKKVARA